MCGIFLTMDPGRVLILSQANESRGSRGRTLEFLKVYDDTMIIGHIVAPTGNNTKPNLHPSKLNQTSLWHNGVITAPTMEALGCDPNTWDTACLHQALDQRGWPVLDEVDGAFACLYFDRVNLYVFRNEAAPLYHGNGEISSTPVDACVHEIEPGIIYRVAPDRLVYRGSFTNKSSPYYFGE